MKSALLALSLLANLALLGAFKLRPALAPPGLRDYFVSAADRSANLAAEQRAQAAVTAANARADVAAETARQAQLWAALATDDLPALIARLRAAGFPPAAIRAVVYAQIEARFAERMKALAGSLAKAPYWQPASSSQRADSEAMEQIYRDRMRALRTLLGDDVLADAWGDPTANERREFGDLPKSKIELIRRINEDYEEMTERARNAAQDIMLPEDRQKLAVLEHEKHADLAAILTPQELADYEMRSSEGTSRLRGALTLMNANETEFGLIYRIRQPFASLLDHYEGGYSPEAEAQRQAAEQQIMAQLKVALGETRAAEFARDSDYRFQELATIAQRENLPPAAAVSAYDLRASTAAESQRIGNDPTLTNELKLAALQTLAQNAAVRLTAVLGPNSGASYAQTADWLQAIKHGSVVTFRGSSASFHQIPLSAATAAAHD
jgi:hypothetical protein